MQFRDDNLDVMYHTVERTMRRIKQSTMPAPPKKVEDIHACFDNETVNEKYARTKQKTNTEKNQFYRTTHICEEFAYTFAWERIIDLIKTYAVDKRRFMIDATFKIVPKMYSQLLVIYFETPSKQVNEIELFMTQLFILFQKMVFFFIIGISVHICANESKVSGMLHAYF